MRYTSINITPKQKEIMMFIYKFRFLNRIQIQTLLCHKDPKRINVWLKDLVEKKYLGRIYSKKLFENTKPAIYYVAIKGIHFFEKRGECNPRVLLRLRKEPYHSARFRNHSLFLAQIYIDLTKKPNPSYILDTFLTKVDLISYKDTPHIFPDAFIKLFKYTGKSKQAKRYFLILIDEGTPRFYLKHMIKKYLDYFSEDHSQEIKVFLVCPNELIRIFLAKFISKMFDDGYYYDNKADFLLAISEDVKNKYLTSNIWMNLKGRN